MEATYNITVEMYWAMYEAQGNACGICQIVKGKGPLDTDKRKKHLCVDHDHQCCPGKTSCGQCVRGLLCTRCNVFVGHVKDSHRAFLRGAEHLVDPIRRRLFP